MPSRIVRSSIPQAIFGLLSLTLLLLLCACGGSSGGSSTPPAPPTITSVGVSASQSIAYVGQPVHFTVVVQGTGLYNPIVQWSVNGVNGGDATNGTIAAGGDYTAPAKIPPTNPVVVKATSTEDPTKSGSATTTVYMLTINPNDPTVLYSRQQQFTATIAGLNGNPPLHQAGGPAFRVWCGGWGCSQITAERRWPS
jgi:hypothetical protein